MKLSSSLYLLLATSLVAAPETKREQNTVVLDANAVANLRLEFASAEPRPFEDTAFALGRIESRPGATTALSSRISGHVVALSATLGESVKADTEIVRVESRQAGDPPPVIALRAPQAGVVTALNIHLGDPVEPDAALLEITDPSAEFALVLSSRAEVLSVPREAVQGEGTAPRVVFTKDLELPGAFVKTPVILGATNDRYVEIVSGLFPGDEVVTDVSSPLFVASVRCV